LHRARSDRASTDAPGQLSWNAPHQCTSGGCWVWPASTAYALADAAANPDSPVHGLLCPTIPDSSPGSDGNGKQKRSSDERMVAGMKRRRPLGSLDDADSASAESRARSEADHMSDQVSAMMASAASQASHLLETRSSLACHHPHDDDDDDGSSAAQNGDTKAETEAFRALCKLRAVARAEAASLMREGGGLS